MTSTLNNDPKPEHYDKAFLSIPEQIEKLVGKKGMLLGDTEQASRLLRTIGYYRLSGYWHFFREASNPKVFKAGASLQDVHALYLFDQELKQRVMAGTGIVEVALRFHLGHQLGRTNAFAHLDPAHLNESWTKTKPSTNAVLGRMEWQDSEHAKFSKKVHSGEKSSAELFATHFKNKYEYPYLPTWVATELFTFGMLTSLYDGSKQNDQKRIASALGFVDEKEVPRTGDLSSVLNHLRYVRNVCAHHSRLWNRGIDVPIPKLDFIPELSHLESYKQGASPRVYDTLALLAYLIGQLDPENTWRQDTIEFIEIRLKNNLGHKLSTMGFPIDWKTERIWFASYQPSYQILQKKTRLFERLPHLPADVAGGLFLLKNDKDPSNSFSARKKRARYARAKGALIGVRVNDQIQVPTFQIDVDAKDLVQCVANVNVRFFIENKLNPSNESSHLSALNWWLSPLPEFGGMSPLELHQTDALDPQISVIVPDRLESKAPGTPNQRKTKSTKIPWLTIAHKRTDGMMREEKFRQSRSPVPGRLRPRDQ